MSFLQDLVTNDVRSLAPGKALYTALLTPQGKFLHDFFLAQSAGKIMVDMDGVRLADLVSRLNLYKLRSKILIEILPDTMGTIALWGDVNIPQSAPGILFQDPRLKELGWRVAGDVAAIIAWCETQGMKREDVSAYDRMRIDHGIPEGVRDMVPDKSFLMEFGFEDLHGVDYSKGCYVGQEIMARSKYRGQIKKFLHIVRAASGELPASGSPVYCADIAIGELRSVSGDVGLAVLRIDEVEKAQDLRAGDVIITAFLPSWATSIMGN